MKVFISWSGAQSRSVALALRDWLPNVIQAVEPYVSSEDIDKGARWSSDISGELESSDYGILCITANNVHAPWVSFEAGALSKSLEQSRVSPFLVGIDRAQVTGPLLQFQSTVIEMDDVRKLVHSINRNAGDGGLAESRLDSIFDVWWPQLEKTLAACNVPDEVSSEVARDEDELLAEVLELVREQHRILRSPESLFPAELIREMTDRSESRFLPAALVRDVEGAYLWLDQLAENPDLLLEDGFQDDLELQRKRLSSATRFLRRRGDRHG